MARVRKRRGYGQRKIKSRPSKPRYNNYAGKVGTALRYGNQAAAIALTAAKVAKLTGLINTEFKYLDRNISLQPNQATGGFVLLNGTDRGDGVSNREGRQLRVKSLQLKYRVIMHSSALRTTTRVMVVVDKKPDGAIFTLADLLEQGGTYPVYGMRNLNNRNRFVILKEWNIATDAVERDTSRVMKYYKNLDMKVTYDDSDTATIADIQNNSLYIVTMSNETTNLPLIEGQARIRFLDN